MLQVALRLFVREKKIFEDLQQYGVTSSYDEVRRCKISAFHRASQDKRSMLDSKRDLIHGVTDRFDAHLSTQNSLKQTHTLTSVVFQHSKSPRKDAREPIPRLKKTSSHCKTQIKTGNKNL